MSADSLKRLTRLSRALSGRDKQLYEDFMKGVKLLEECDNFEHNPILDSRIRDYLARVKDFWPIKEMR